MYELNKREYRSDEHNSWPEDCRGRAFKWSRNGAVVIARGFWLITTRWLVEREKEREIDDKGRSGENGKKQERKRVYHSPVYHNRVTSQALPLDVKMSRRLARLYLHYKSGRVTYCCGSWCSKLCSARSYHCLRGRRTNNWLPPI